MIFLTFTICNLMITASQFQAFVSEAEVFRQL